MKLKVFDEGHRSPEVLLRLVPAGDLHPGGVTLAIVDETGVVLAGGHIVTLTAAGELFQHGFVANNLGLMLEDTWQVVKVRG